MQVSWEGSEKASAGRAARSRRKRPVHSSAKCMASHMLPPLPQERSFLPERSAAAASTTKRRTPARHCGSSRKARRVAAASSKLARTGSGSAIAGILEVQRRGNKLRHRRARARGFVLDGRRQGARRGTPCSEDRTRGGRGVATQPGSLMYTSSAFVSPRLGIFFLLALAPSLAAQNPGEVLWHQKISASKGNGPRNLRVNDQFGRAAANIGDLDGDGVVDLAVGALGDDDPPPGVMADDTLQYGACWILFMNRDGTVKSHTKISRSSAALPLDPGDEWGRSVRELGDWDLDGIPDVMVGTCYDDDNGTDKGAVYLLFLRRDGTVKSWKKISETAGGFTGDLDADDQFGRGIRVLGDLDLDGVPEIGVGAIRDDDGGSNRGAYWILFMRRDGTVRSWTKLSETKGNFQSKLSDYGEFGFDACVLGDRNGDGIQDIAISSPDQKTDGNQQGAVFIVYLNRDGTAKSDFRIAENHSGFLGDMLDYNDEFGCAIDLLGDVDRDGISDLAVGAGKDDDGLAGAFDK